MGFFKCNCIGKGANAIFQNVLGVKRSTQNDFVYGEVGILDLKTVRLASVIKYWFKIHTQL